MACSRNEGSARSIGRILIDISETIIRGIDIAGGINSETGNVGKRTDSGPASIWCKLIDNAAVIVGLEKITGAIKSYPPRAIEVSREGVLRAIRRDSQNRARVETSGYVKISRSCVDTHWQGRGGNDSQPH